MDKELYINELNKELFQSPSSEYDDELYQNSSESAVELFDAVVSKADIELYEDESTIDLLDQSVDSEDLVYPYDDDLFFDESLDSLEQESFMKR